MHIILNNVSLRFHIARIHENLRTFLINLLRPSVKEAFDQGKYLTALDNVSLSLSEGDRLGIVGPNGSGKTTLLRLIAGIYTPMSGEISLDGKVTSFLSITNGSHPDLTGYETIMSQLLLVGLDKSEIEGLTPHIAEFSELGQFLNAPIKNYSSGMGMRLCFSIMTSINPEILLMDEWLSTGDIYFIDKAHKRITDVVDRSKIMVLASHDLDLLKATCNKVIWLERGKVRAYGEASQVISAYKASAKDIQHAA